jgi:two-component system LytT family response regulator
MPSEIRVIIADDEPLARQRLRHLCARESDIAVVGEAGDGAQAEALVDEHQPDLLFLDVQMPEPGGLTVAARARARGGDRAPLVVLVTAYREHAVEAFDLDAVDYLVKPFDVDRFHAAIDRVRERLAARASSEGGARPRAIERIPVRSGLRIRFVEMKDLDYITAEGNYVTLHAGGHESLIRETLVAMEKRLDPEAFVRVHRSTIVRIDRVEEIEPLASGEFVLKLRGGVTLTSGRSFRQTLVSAFGI